MCLCLGCGDMGGVCGQWVGGLGTGSGRMSDVMSV